MTIDTESTNTDCNANNAPSFDADDKERKKQLVLQTLLSHCHETSKVRELRAMSQAAVQDLVCDVLSGGYTNYAYRICLPKTTTTPDDVQLFAKLTFEYPAWKTDTTPFSLERTLHEYQAMIDFANLLTSSSTNTNENDSELSSPPPPPVATPYLCVDVTDSDNTKYKLLVTQWAPVEEPLANQFIEGHVDPRVITTVAESLAILHAFPNIDPNWNDCFRSGIDTTFAPMKETIVTAIFDDKKDMNDCVEFGRQLGVNVLHDSVDAMMNEMKHKRQVWVHGDAHSFNILVESSIGVDDLEETRGTFGPTGRVCFCDWEMTGCGPWGRDCGVFMAWPIACALTHAMLGNEQQADAIWKSIERFWDCYIDSIQVKMREQESQQSQSFVVGKDVRLALRTAMAASSFFLFVVNYLLGIQTEFLPTQDLSEKDRKTLLASIGLTGLKLMILGYGESITGVDHHPEYNIEELRDALRSIVQEQREKLSSIARERETERRPRRRVSSILRETGRRVSDAFMMEQAIEELRQERSSLISADS